MKNFRELQEFLETASVDQRQAYLKSAPVLEQGLVHALDGNHTFLMEAAQNDLTAYLAFVSQFYHDQCSKILLFNDLNLFTLLLKYQHHTFVRDYQAIHQPSGQEIFYCLSLLGVIWEMDYEVARKQNLIHESLRPYNYLLSVEVDLDNDEIKLLSSVMDTINLELFISGDKILARVKPQEEIKVAEKKQSWMDQISLIVSSMNPEPSKYLGIALALGIGLLSSTDAHAGSKDAKDYLHKVDQSLSKIDVPTGCQMGAKILASNGIGMTYEIQLGDFVVRTDFQKVGHISERTEQTTYKLKEQKGCGLSKSDAIEMATKVDKMVYKLWAGAK